MTEPKSSQPRTMRYRYFALFRVAGVVFREHEPEKTVIDDLNSSLSATLVHASTDLLFDVNRKFAALKMMCRAKLGHESDPGFLDLLQVEMESVISERKKGDSEALLLICKDSSTPKFNPRFSKDCGPFDVGNDAVDAKSIQTLHRVEIESVIAAILSAIPRVRGFKCEFETIVFFNEQDKPFYSYSMQLGDCDAYISSPVEADEVDRINEHYKLISNDDRFTSVLRLLRISFNLEPDKLRAFLAAWNGFEIFVEKQFAKCKDRIFDCVVLSREADPMVSVFAKVWAVIKPQFRLIHKFTAIAMVLDAQSANTDIEKVKRIKAIRNSLAHGGEIPDRELPVKETRELFRKYVTLAFTFDSTNPNPPCSFSGNSN